jgi:hypothetical protein
MASGQQDTSGLNQLCNEVINLCNAKKMKEFIELGT